LKNGNVKYLLKTVIMDKMWTFFYLDFNNRVNRWNFWKYL